MSPTQERVTRRQRWGVLPKRARYFFYLKARRALDHLAPSSSRSGMAAFSPDQVEQWKTSLRAWRPFLETAAVPLRSEQVLRRAQQAARLELSLLGATWALPEGAAALPGPAWRTDPVSGYQWPREQWYRDAGRDLPPGVDIKAPWELSRCYHFLNLGQAYQLSRREDFAEAFGLQLRDWIAQNPVCRGPNWANAMETGIRIANWLTAALYFLDSASLGHDFWAALLQSARQHGRFIMANTENINPLTSNHYLANLGGLLFVALLCPVLPKSARWREVSQNELEREIIRQTYDDGWDFEASTAYHRLVTEIFLYSYLLAQLSPRPFSANYAARLKAMLKVLAEVQKPDGCIPQIGDNDSGRFLVFNCDRPPGNLQIDHLLRPIGACPELSFPAVSGSVAHTGAGRYIFRSSRFHLVVVAGPKGQAGNGGHAHNDVMSFELNVDGQDLVVDPGTYTYTRDPKARNSFRSVACHNTLYWPGLEPCSLNHGLFRLPEQGHLSVNYCRMGCEEEIVAARYDYKGRTHQREIKFYPGSERIFVHDRCSHSGAWLNFSCAPELRPVLRADGFTLGPVGFRFQEIASIETTPSHYSRGYGHRRDNLRISVALPGLECFYIIELANPTTPSEGS